MIQVDLYLIHNPFFDKASHGIDRAEAWREMDKIYKVTWYYIIHCFPFSFSPPPLPGQSLFLMLPICSFLLLTI